jgi:ABC-type dipeptide/oligopeptide/nickel transport system permease component
MPVVQGVLMYIVVVVVVVNIAVDVSYAYLDHKARYQ